MKVILLAGGFGTRMSEYTATIPKPMVEIGGRPILWHIMNTYASFGHTDFYIALGYKGEIIKQYFSQYHASNSDFSINISTGKMRALNSSNDNWQVTLINTGIDTMTGGRVKRMQPYLGKNEPVLMTYGDGVSNIDIDALIDFHKSHGKMVTMSAVRPPARFGELEISNGLVTSFEEKPQLHEGWINGGYFVLQPEFFDLIDGDMTMMEREPLEKATISGQLMAYKHDGFWQCMDTKRDHEMLERLWADDMAPWKTSMVNAK
jgi:glucose-1-phosphate cytidylyltransferase